MRSRCGESKTRTGGGGREGKTRIEGGQDDEEILTTKLHECKGNILFFTNLTNNGIHF